MLAHEGLHCVEDFLDRLMELLLIRIALLDLVQYALHSVSLC